MKKMRGLVKIIFMLFIMWQSVFAVEKVGVKDFGYLSLPKGFKEVSDSVKVPIREIKYSDDITNFTLITFYNDDYDLEIATNSVYGAFQNIEVENIKKEEFKFKDKYESFKITADYDNATQVLIAYLFEANDRIQLLILEGPREKLEENLKILETYEEKI